ncbi:hypothetical protein DFH06DRAFT_565714 [Mycena polygramma]|nr:hypothetical protein DFH06DRAFT_565714 [Mycena polygramma]
MELFSSLNSSRLASGGGSSTETMLKALLTQTMEEHSKQELKLRVENLELKYANQRFKLRRMADEAIIQSLEAELVSVKEIVVKHEDPHGTIPPPFEEHTTDEPNVMIIDSSDETNAASPSLVGISRSASSDSSYVAGQIVSRHSAGSDPEVVNEVVIDMFIKSDGQLDQLRHAKIIQSEGGDWYV